MKHFFPLWFSISMLGYFTISLRIFVLLGHFSSSFGKYMTPKKSQKHDEFLRFFLLLCTYSWLSNQLTNHTWLVCLVCWLAGQLKSRAAKSRGVESQQLSNLNLLSWHRCQSLIFFVFSRTFYWIDEIFRRICPIIMCCKFWRIYSYR